MIATMATDNNEHPTTLTMTVWQAPKKKEELKKHSYSKWTMSEVAAKARVAAAAAVAAVTAIAVERHNYCSRDTL